jgi:hypothetical protein
MAAMTFSIGSVDSAITSGWLITLATVVSFARVPVATTRNARSRSVTIPRGCC